MKKILLTIALIGCSICTAAPTEIWVSPDGNDFNPGTKAEPKQSIHGALRQGRELRRLNDPAAKDGITILVKGGYYQLNEPIFIRHEDSGTENAPTVIKNADKELPVISGGRTVSGWKKAGRVTGLPKETQGKVWVAKAPLLSGRPFDFRQMWVNGEKAIRARDNAPENMRRILGWKKNEREMWIPTPKEWKVAGDPSPMEFTVHQMWAIAHLRIREFVAHGDSTLVLFHEPESRIQFEHPWPTPMQDREKDIFSPFYLSNHICLLNEPGEWFYDYKTQNIYYYPREGENMLQAEVIVPAIETLVRIEGILDKPVSHITIDGLQFNYTTWTRPSEQGHVPLQAGQYLIDAYKLPVPGTPEKKGLENQGWHGRPPGAVMALATQNITIQNCRFEHLGSAGLDFIYGTHYDLIEGNLFRDIAGNPIQYGKVSDEVFESHLVYNPSDPREISQHGRIANNLITDGGNEDWGAVGILAGCVRYTTIENNELSWLPYSAISLGWGWTKLVGGMCYNTVKANYVHHYATRMSDTAAVYTLSAQPGTVVTENRAEEIMLPPYVHDPNHWFWYYTDEGSAYMEVSNNWCPSDKFLRNANGPGVTWENNGPMVSDEIKNAAGLKPEFKHLQNL